MVQHLRDPAPPRSGPGRKPSPHLLALIAAFLLSLTLVAGPGPAAKDDKGKDPKSEACMECHEEILAQVRKTPHHIGAKVGCTDCHPSTQEHLDDATADNIQTPRGKAALKACLSCHDMGGSAMAARHGAHAKADVNCMDCHFAHGAGTSADAKLVGTWARLIRKADRVDEALGPRDSSTAVTALCASCHKDSRADFKKPFTHRLGHGGMDCASCHDPHGGFGKASLKKSGGEAGCLGCHSEKRGPHVFEHVTGIAGDCLSCHESHGSANPHQLTRSNMAQLCLECHTEQPLPTFGTQPTGAHDLRSPRYQNCTSCHTAIHGSSRSPALLE